MSEVTFGRASVRASHAWSRTPSVTSTRSFIAAAFTTSGIFFGSSWNAEASSSPPQASRASAATMPAVLRPPNTTRRRPSDDIARWRTCWGISFQWRAGVSVGLSGFTR